MEFKDMKLSSRQILLDIGSMFVNAKRLLDANKAYNLLLKTLIELDYYNDPNVSLPSLKDLSKITGIPYSGIRKQLRQIYFDLIFSIDLNESIDNMFSFTELIYTFHIYSFEKDKAVSFETKHLPVVPRVGEEVTIPFFKAYLCVDRFYVEKIYHNFYDQRQEIQIILNYGEFSPYWRFRKSRAYEEGEISINDYISCSDWELKRKLKVRVK